MGCLKLTYCHETELSIVYNKKELTLNKSSENLRSDELYLYNSKELQEETGWYDYGARMYMPDLGRWTTQDPLADFGPGISPYSFCFNNPVSTVDPDGLWPWDDPATKRKKKQQRVNNKRRRQQNRANKKRDRQYGKGKKYNPNFHTIAPHEPGQRWNPPRAPEFKLSLVEDDIEIDDIEFDFDDVQLPEMKPFNLEEEYYRDLERRLTGRPRNFTSSFGSRPGHHDGYISSGRSGFDAYVKQIAELINQKPHIKVKVIVSTGYKSYESLTHDGNPINIYTVPGVKIVGTSNRLLRARRDYIKSALTGAGVPSSNVSTSYKFEQKNSVIIQVTK